MINWNGAAGANGSFQPPGYMPSVALANMAGLGHLFTNFMCAICTTTEYMPQECCLLHLYITDFRCLPDGFTKLESEFGMESFRPISYLWSAPVGILSAGHMSGMANGFNFMGPGGGGQMDGSSMAGLSGSCFVYMRTKGERESRGNACMANARVAAFS
jgi:hypothetical protein